LNKNSKNLISSFAQTFNAEIKRLANEMELDRHKYHVLLSKRYAPAEIAVLRIQAELWENTGKCPLFFLIKEQMISDKTAAQEKAKKQNKILKNTKFVHFCSEFKKRGSDAFIEIDFKKHQIDLLQNIPLDDIKDDDQKAAIRAIIDHHKQIENQEHEQ